MSFTKVAPAGIGTEPGDGYRIGDSFLHSTGINLGSGTTISHSGSATFTGIITAANISAASSVTATEFYGDGSNLDGVSSSGIGTALNDDDTNVLNKIYYVNQELSIGSTVTVNHPDTGTASYTHYQDLVVKNDADFIVADGDTFIPDILGITTSTLAASAATGGRIRAGTITNAGANGAPNFPNGLTGTAGTFTGNLNVAGVLTYEDVTNVDSVGVITARDGLRVTGIATISGKVLIGTTNVPSNKNTVTPSLNVSGSGVLGSAQITRHTGVGGGGALLHLAGTRGSDVNSYTILQNNDGIGTLAFNAADGNEFVTAAEVSAQVDGTPGDNDMPGRLLFKTTADGASSPTERLRIGSAGQLGIGGANYGTSGQVLTSAGSGSAVQWATPAGGKILQVVNVFKGDGFTTNSTSFTDITGLSISITPSSTSSKIMLSCSMGAAGTRINNGDFGNGIRVMRDIGGGGYSNDNKLNGAADGSRDRITFKGHGWSYNNDHMPGGVGFTGVDDPNTTSAVTYKVQVVCQSSSYAFFLNRNSTNGNNSSIAQARSMTSLIAMEIGG